MFSLVVVGRIFIVLKFGDVLISEYKLMVEYQTAGKGIHAKKIYRHLTLPCSLTPTPHSYYPELKL